MLRSKYIYVTERELINGCIEKDPAYEKLLFDTYAGVLMTVCRRYSKDSQEAEDWLQDSFVQIFKNIKSFKHEGSFEGWLKRITANTALRHIKKSSYQREFSGLDNIPPILIEPDALANLNEEQLLTEIRKLPEGYRLIFNMYVIEGFSHKEIAQRLQIKESTSRSQLVKAKRYLKKLLSKLYMIFL